MVVFINSLRAWEIYTPGAYLIRLYPKPDSWHVGRSGNARHAPICELQFADFIFSAGDEVFLKMSYWRWAHDGAFDIPMVMRAPSGGFYGPSIPCVLRPT